MTKTFEDRLRDAFNGRGLGDIAEKLGVNYHTLRNWATARNDIPSTALVKIAELTNVSLNWLLTGEGDKYLLADRKEFDVERSIESNNDWRDVIAEWYDFEGKPPPDHIGASFMGGWKGFTLTEKIDAITDYKTVLDRLMKTERR